ncbi:hypothetical protein N7522_002947 [Penicillium canescens]|nr:hypothetical protein N7522_002947 [Penicillium canescens]
MASDYLQQLIKYNSWASALDDHLADVPDITKYLGLFTYIRTFQLYLKFSARCIDGTPRNVEIELRKFFQAPETLSFKRPD